MLDNHVFLTESYQCLWFLFLVFDFLFLEAEVEVEYNPRYNCNHNYHNCGRYSDSCSTTKALLWWF